MTAMRIGVILGIAVTAGAVTAVTRRATGEPEAVLVNGWPTQAIDARFDEQLAQAIATLHDTIRSDVDSVVVAYPIGFGPTRTRRLWQAVEDAGWPGVRMVAVPVAVGITHSPSYGGGVVAVVDSTGKRWEASILVPQPGTTWGCVASRVIERGGQSAAELVAAAADAAEIHVAEIKKVVVLGAPPAVHDTTRRVTEAGIRGAVAVSPVDLAAEGLVADDVITREGERSGNQSRARGSWPRPVSSLACAVASLVATVTVVSGAGSAGAQPNIPTLALASLALFTAIIGAASYCVARVVTNRPGPAGWARAGRALLIGTGVGIASVTAAVLVVATSFSVPAWPLVLASGLAVLPSAIACAVIAVGIAWHPETPPTRNLWPPVGAMSAVTVAAVFVHNSELDAYAVSGWDLLPARLAVGVWLFAITGLIVSKPWPRVLIGLSVGVAAALAAGPSTVMVFAVIVIAVVSGWWLVTASLTSYDRHGLPTLTPPHLPGGVAQQSRTV